MAVIQISRIQHRRGLEADLPNLASAELGWSVDTRKLYIGNGTIQEGAPSVGKTEILTEYSILDYQSSFASNITTLQGNVIVLESNIASLQADLSALSSTTIDVSLDASSTGSVFQIENSNNIVISYTLNQGGVQRTGSIVASMDSSSVGYSEEFTETNNTDIILTMSGNSTLASVDYTTTTSTEFSYRISSIS